MAHLCRGNTCFYNGVCYYREISMMMMHGGRKCSTVCDQTGVHDAKAEECTTPCIGGRNIKIKIGGGGLPRNQK